MVIFFNWNEHCNSLSHSDARVGETVGCIVGKELDMLCSEDSAYEYFCDIADRFIGTPITAVARFSPSCSEGVALFRSRIRAIYRASVWGQFSLLCTGIATPSELKSCADILKEVFCELESEGREFNGFIEKGVSVDTPMILYKLTECPRFDLLCFDIERLHRLCTGKSGTSYSYRELFVHIEKICQEIEKCEIAIKATSLKLAKESISDSALAINKIFLSDNTSPTIMN